MIIAMPTCKAQVSYFKIFGCITSSYLVCITINLTKFDFALEILGSSFPLWSQLLTMSTPGHEGNSSVAESRAYIFLTFLVREVNRFSE